MPQTLPVPDLPSPQRVLSLDHDFYAASHNEGGMVSDFGQFVQIRKLLKSERKPLKSATSARMAGACVT